MPVSQINSYRQVGKPLLLARSTLHKDVLCNAASHFFHPAMRGSVCTRTGTHTLHLLTWELLPGEKEGQSFFTWAVKLRLSLAPPQEGSGSRGVVEVCLAPNVVPTNRGSRRFLPALSHWLSTWTTELGTWDICCILGFLGAGRAGGVFHITLLNNI